MAGRESDNDEPIEIGLDGLPVDKSVIEGHERAWHERFERDMCWGLARWQRGDVMGVVVATEACWRHRKPPPEWLVDAGKVLAERAMPKEERRARAEFERHFERWESLTALRERRDDLAAHGDDRAISWEEARAAVAERLAGTDAAGTERTIKASYELVQAAGGERATFESYMQLRRRDLKNREI
jgi:hypothetical protein